MELIVKIGADQAKLNETITRMKDQFRTMNTSMGGGMAAQNQAFQRYGSIMQKAGAGSGGGLNSLVSELSRFSPAVGGVVDKIASFAGPLGVFGAALTAAGVATKIFISKVMENAAVAREARITGLSDSMIKNIKHAGETSDIGGDQAILSVKRLLAKAGEAMAGNKDAKGLFSDLGINPDGLTSDELVTQAKGKLSGIKDPAKRERLSTGLFGKSAYDISEMLNDLDTKTTGSENRDVEQLASFKERFSKKWNAFTRALDKSLTEAAALAVYKKGAVKEGAGTSQLITADPEESEKAKKEREKADQERAKARAETYKGISEFFAKENLRKSGEKSEEAKRQMEIEKVKPFAADSMAQAGLFTGSSLLFNPAMNVSQQQLEVLRRIEGKIGSNPFIQ